MGTTMASSALAPDGAEPPVLEPVLRRARWVAAAVAVAAFALYPDIVRGAEPRLAALPSAALVVAGLAILNLLSLRATRSPRSARRRSALLQVAGDALIVLFVVAALGYDRDGALWILLALPVLEAAARWQVRGALATCAVAGSAWAVVERWAGTTYGEPLAAESYLYRLAVLAAVAVVAGEGSRLVRTQMDRHVRAGELAARRAALLEVTATAGPVIATLEPSGVLDAVVEAVVDLGFDAVHISVVEHDGQTWRVAAASDASRPLLGSCGAAGDGVAGEVRRAGVTVVADAATASAAERAWLEAAGCRTIVASPVWADGRLAAVLEAGRRFGRPPACDELECIDLLAGQAGAALTNSRRVRAEPAQGLRAFHDPRTGLPDRLLLQDRLEHALAASARTSSLVALVDLEVDADGSGGAVLPALARRLTGAVRPADTVAATGADRFAVLAVGLVSLDDVVRLMDRVMAEVRRPVVVDGENLPVSVSAGIALGRAGSPSSEHLIRQAELAMHQAVHAGGDRYEVFNAAVHLRLLEAGELQVTMRRVVERW